LESAQRKNADVIGLSSLMTTTLDEMQRVIRLRDQQAPRMSVIVGGAAVSPSFAREIGADAYGKDALDAVRRIKDLLRERS
jgi:5-methyltetrahydrofolate--homocysteine methyltransferase